MKRHGLDGLYQGGYGRSNVKDEPDRWILQFGDLPQLTFFMELASLCGVPMESIKTDTDESYSGCDTCGYGAGIEYTVIVQKANAANSGAGGAA